MHGERQRDRSVRKTPAADPADTGASTDESPRKDRAAPTLGAEEERILAERLRDLGYIE